MEVTYQINSGNYIKLMFTIAYRKATFIFMFCGGFYLIFQMIVDLVTGKFFYLELSTRFLVIMMIIYIFIISPLTLYLRFRNAFKTQKILGEKVTTTFTNESITDVAESYTTEIKWNAIHKVKELSGWFLFYHNNISFGFLPKKDLSEKQIVDLRTIIHKSGVKAKLKNN